MTKKEIIEPIADMKNNVETTELFFAKWTH